MAAATAESCRFVVLRSPWGRLGSLLDARKRLHRTRGGFHRCIHISKVLCALLLWTMICQRFRSRALWRAPSTAACGVGDYPTPDLSRRSPRADLHPKKVNNLGPMAPRSRQGSGPRRPRAPTTCSSTAILGKMCPRCATVSNARRRRRAPRRAPSSRSSSRACARASRARSSSSSVK